MKICSAKAWQSARRIRWILFGYFTLANVCPLILIIRVCNKDQQNTFYASVQLMISYQHLHTRSHLCMLLQLPSSHHQCIHHQHGFSVTRRHNTNTTSCWHLVLHVSWLLKKYGRPEASSTHALTAYRASKPKMHWQSSTQRLSDSFDLICIHSALGCFKCRWLVCCWSTQSNRLVCPTDQPFYILV